eukprot:1084788-Alexandrium_andersonii.AAC.1
MARANERASEHVARQVQNRVGVAAAAMPRSEGAQSSGGGAASVRVAPARGEQGELSGQAEPAR